MTRAEPTAGNQMRCEAGERAGRGVVDARGRNPCQHKHVANLFFLSKQISRLIAEFGGRCSVRAPASVQGNAGRGKGGEKKNCFACGKESWTQRRMTKTLLICFAYKPVFIPGLSNTSRVEAGCPTANRLPTTSRVDARVSTWDEYAKSSTLKSRDSPMRAGGRGRMPGRLHLSHLWD